MESLFSVGDKVICVNSKPNWNPKFGMPLIEGKQYVIIGLHICACGVVDVNVGVNNPSNSGHLRCNCGVISLNSYWTFEQTRFIKPDTDQALSDQITEALNEDLKVKL